MAAPHVAVLKLSDEFAGSGTGEIDGFGGQAGFWSEAVNAAAVVASANVLVLAHFLGDVIGMFDHVALHIDDVKRAVGSEFEANETGGGIGAGNEFAGGF